MSDNNPADLPVATEQAIARVREAIDREHARGCHYRHQQGETDECRSCAASAIEAALDGAESDGLEAVAPSPAEMERAVEVFSVAWEESDPLLPPGERVESGLRALLLAGWKPPVLAVGECIVDEPKHCCEHDSDAHDGAGCLDCPCPLGPPHVGYNPKPTHGER